MVDESSRPPTPPGEPDPEARGDDIEAQKKRDRERKERRHKGDLHYASLVSNGMWFLTLIGVIIIALTLCTLGWHMLAPGGPESPNWHWLCPDELRSVKDFILSGALVTLATQYVRRYMEER